MGKGFTKIFWGLLFVVLDIRIGHLDLLLPDFLGYLAVAWGLGDLARVHPDFRRARPIALVLMIASLVEFPQIEMTPGEAALYRRQALAAVTGRLAFLAPENVDGAALEAAGTAPGTESPLRARYEDGTTVLIYRFDSPAAARAGFDDLQETEYSASAIHRRAQTDPSFEVEALSIRGASSGYEDRALSVESAVAAGERSVLLWWNAGRRLWNPWTWKTPGGWWSGRLVFAVEGFSDSAEAFKAALTGSEDGASAVTLSLSPVFPVTTLAEVLSIALVWLLCSGIADLARSVHLRDLEAKAYRWRSYYLVVTVFTWSFVLFIFTVVFVFGPPRVLAGSAGGVGVFGAAVAAVGLTVASVLVQILILILVRRAARIAPPNER